MAIVQWTPFRDLEKMFEEDDFFFPVARRGFTPAMNLYEDENNVVAEFELPGMKGEDFDVSVENNVLTVRGERKEEEENKGKGYYRKEVRSGSFQRAVQLPVQVQGDSAKAAYKDGVLTVTMPKSEHVKAKKINVEVNEK